MFLTYFQIGYGTSSTTLAYCIYELSLNEDIRRMARKSVEDAIQKHGNLLTYDSLCDMQYLDQCLKGNNISILGASFRMFFMCPQKPSGNTLQLSAYSALPRKTIQSLIPTSSSKKVLAS